MYIVIIKHLMFDEIFDYVFDDLTDALSFYEQEKGNRINGEIITIYECKMIDTHSLEGI